MAADPDNLRIQQQINAAIAERSKLLSSQTSLISDQVELAVKFCKAMKCEGIDEISDRITQIRAGRVRLRQTPAVTLKTLSMA